MGLGENHKHRIEIVNQKAVEIPGVPFWSDNFLNKPASIHARCVPVFEHKSLECEYANDEAQPQRRTGLPILLTVVVTLRWIVLEVQRGF